MTTVLGFAMLVAAAALRTRLGRLWLAVALMRLANVLFDAGSGILDGAGETRH